MSDLRTAFFEAIAAEPDSDAPRLVYADWLDDRGEADRAELIRVQCELARLKADGSESQALYQALDDEESLEEVDWAAVDPGVARRVELQARSDALLKKH